MQTKLAAAARIAADGAARHALADALGRLAAHLLAHRDYEDASPAPTLRRLTV